MVRFIEQVRRWWEKRHMNRYRYWDQGEYPKRHFKIIELRDRLAELGLDVFFGYDADLGPIAEVQYHSKTTNFRVSVSRAGDVEDCMRDAVWQAIKLADGELREKMRQALMEVGL